MTSPPVPQFFVRYVACWVVFCFLAVGIVVGDRRELSLELHKYLSFLCVPWKIGLFVPALLFVTFAGRYTDDETWDVVTGAGMSILTFLTAPWAVGLFFQVLTAHRHWRYLLVGAALLLFSSSWFYDGLLWNLEAKDRFGFRFSFVRADWPSPPTDTRFLPLLLVSIPLILIAAFVLVGFVGWRLKFIRK